MDDCWEKNSSGKGGTSTPCTLRIFRLFFLENETNNSRTASTTQANRQIYRIATGGKKIIWQLKLKSIFTATVYTASDP